MFENLCSQLLINPPRLISETTMAPWADLGIDLLEIIAERITRHTDFLHFGAVCTQWRSVLLSNLHRLPYRLPLDACLHPQQPLPLLMECRYKNATRVLDFMSIAKKKIYRGFTSTKIYNRYICGSFNGWVVTIGFDGRQIHLLNPLTMAQIPLPSISSFQNPVRSFKNEIDDFRFVQKVVVLSPSSGRKKLGEDCIVASIISSCVSVLSICKLGDDKWTNIKGSRIYLTDIIPYKGKIYAVNAVGSVVACDVANDSKITLIAGQTPDEPGSFAKRYLVESIHGDLLQVVRIEVDFETFYFEVYKLVAADEFGLEQAPSYCYQAIDGEAFTHKKLDFGWVEVESIGEQMLFLGHNCSMALPASSYPSCRGNSIYFTDDSPFHKVVLAQDIRDGNEMGYFETCDLDFSKCDMGMYDMEAGKIFRFGEINYAVWVVPNPW